MVSEHPDRRRTIAADDAVFSSLARFVLEHDLVARVVFKHFPPEHPLRWQFEDFRAGEVSDPPTGSGCGCSTSRAR
ncbi:hypothetical protein STANM309S_00375 [Streptomyces tanashiensis]